MDYESILKKEGSFRNAAKACGLSKAKFTTLYKKQLGLCTATTACPNKPEPNKTRCKDHLKYAVKTRNKELKREYTKKWQKENRKHLRKKAKEYYYDNHEKQREYYNNYAKTKYKTYNAEKRARRRASLKNATPKWANVAELKSIFKKCPEGFHVDHIIPLTHEDVCGLHVPANLQYLPSAINEAKGNSFDHTYDNKSWMDKYCHQYKRRLETTNEDIKNGHRFDLKASEFDLSKENITNEHKEFIERYEWLGTMGWQPKWAFTARHKGKLAAVVLISEPTSYSKWEETGVAEMEALIQRGAAASWAPKNLNSRLLMFSCRWMVKNTDKRIFYGYSDSSAGEVGIIYQACNFKYLGQNFGTRYVYTLPSGKKISSRYFTTTKAMKIWAKELGIEWQDSWTKPNKYQNIKAIPEDIKVKLNDYALKFKNSCKKTKAEKKGKYMLILGKTKTEQKSFNRFYSKFKIYPYKKR